MTLQEGTCPNSLFSYSLARKRWAAQVTEGFVMEMLAVPNITPGCFQVYLDISVDCQWSLKRKPIIIILLIIWIFSRCLVPDWWERWVCWAVENLSILSKVPFTEQSISQGKSTSKESNTVAVIISKPSFSAAPWCLEEASRHLIWNVLCYQSLSSRRTHAGQKSMLVLDRIAWCKGMNGSLTVAVSCCKMEHNCHTSQQSCRLGNTTPPPKKIQLKRIAHPSMGVYTE